MFSVRAKTLFAIIIILLTLWYFTNKDVAQYLFPRQYCAPGLTPDPNNEKLCVPGTDQEPSYYQTVKEMIFMFMVFTAITYIFTRRLNK